MTIAVAGCYYGAQGDAGGEPPAGSSDGGDESSGAGTDESGGSPEACADADVGPANITRLNRLEYTSSVKDLLGVAVDPETLPLDDRVGPFSSNALTLVAEYTVEQYFTQAQDAAARAVNDLDALVPCSPSDACAEEFATSLARRAYRRPATEEEIDRLMGVYALGDAQDGFPRGIELVVQSVLMSPHFLYRVEIGDAEPVFDLGPFELATRLSFFLWRSLPDDALLDAAEAGALADANLEDQVRRLVADPRAGASIAAFHVEWLALDTLDDALKDAVVFPSFTPELATSMRVEAERFSSNVVVRGDGRLATLLTAPFSFVDAELAELYGVEAPEPWGRVEFDPSVRSGLLTQAAFLATAAHPDESAPVIRGKVIRENLLCEDLPAPPPDVDDVPAPVDPSVPNRERFERHSTDPGCAGCHVLMDPLGFGLESFDGIGRFRTQSGGQPIDVSGEFVGTEDIDGPFVGAVELSERLAASAQVRRCVVKQWFRYAVGRGETEQDTCTLDALTQAFEASDGDIGELLVAIATSPAFRKRRLPTEGP